jgi:putative heme iron utilization protein
MTASLDARRFLRTRRAGVLATVSERLAGYPFGSVLSFVLDADARPVFLASALAEHTRNLAADPRCSLFVQEAAEDVQAAARLTLVGDCEPIDAAPPLVDRFLRYHPDGRQLLDLGDFTFHRIEPRAIRFIGGFGRIKWIELDGWRPAPHALPDAETDILEHMNDDHADALVRYAARAGVTDAGDVRMIGIDLDGLDLRVDGMVVRVPFDAPVTDAAGARRALVALARDTDRMAGS